MHGCLLCILRDAFTQLVHGSQHILPQKSVPSYWLALHQLATPRETFLCRAQQRCATRQALGFLAEPFFSVACWFVGDVQGTHGGQNSNHAV